MGACVVAYEQGITYPVKVVVAEREDFKHLHPLVHILQGYGARRVLLF